jgi:hypothetical protein
MTQEVTSTINGSVRAVTAIAASSTSMKPTARVPIPAAFRQPPRAVADGRELDAAAALLQRWSGRRQPPQPRRMEGSADRECTGWLCEQTRRGLAVGCLQDPSPGPSLAGPLTHAHALRSRLIVG